MITSWAGLRPLISNPEVSQTTDISRQEEVIESADGLISIGGGKLTTYRLMAENGINLAERRLHERGDRPPSASRTAQTPICGGDLDRAALSGLADQLAVEHELPLSTARHLVFNYGSETPRLIALIEEDADLRLPLVDGLPSIAAEALYAVRHEMALSVTDVMTRRTRLAMLAGATTMSGAERVADIMARELGWSAEERTRQLEDLHQELLREYLAPGPSSTQKVPTR